MGKREYDKQYQRAMTRVIQVRLHVDKDADILRVLDADKAKGTSYAHAIKWYLREGFRFDGLDPWKSIDSGE